MMAGVCSGWLRFVSDYGFQMLPNWCPAEFFTGWAQKQEKKVTCLDYVNDGCGGRI